MQVPRGTTGLFSCNSYYYAENPSQPSKDSRLHKLHKMQPQMNTDKHRSVLLTRKSFTSCQGFSSAGSWERTHPACRLLDTQGTLEACAPRDDLRGLRVSAVRFLVAALLLRVYPCSSVVSFYAIHADAVARIHHGTSG